MTNRSTVWQTLTLIAVIVGGLAIVDQREKRRLENAKKICGERAAYISSLLHDVQDRIAATTQEASAVVYENAVGLSTMRKQVQDLQSSIDTVSVSTVQLERAIRDLSSTEIDDNPQDP